MKSVKEFIDKNKIGFMFWSVIGLIVSVYLIKFTNKPAPVSAELNQKLLEAKLCNEEVAKNNLAIQKTIALYNTVQDSVLITQDSEIEENQAKIEYLKQVLAKQNRIQKSLLVSNDDRMKLQIRYDSLLIVNRQLTIDYNKAIDELKRNPNSTDRKNKPYNLVPDAGNGSKRYNESKAIVERYNEIFKEFSNSTSKSNQISGYFDENGIMAAGIGSHRNGKQMVIEAYEDVIREDSIKLQLTKRIYKLMKSPK